MPLTIAQADQQVVSESLTTADWVVAAAVLVGSVIAAQILKRLVARAVEGAGGDERIARAVGRWVAYAIVLGGVVTFLVILGVRLGPLLATFAALGVAIAFALTLLYGILWWRNPGFPIAPRAVIVLLVLLNARQNLRQYKYARLLEGLVGRN